MQDTIRIITALITFAFCAYLLVSGADREQTRKLQLEIDLKRMEILKQESLLKCSQRNPLPYLPKPVNLKLSLT